MHRFYSQRGEDFLLNELFKGEKDGFFVEVGCIDGRRFSNTLFFEEMGWRGLCVEAHAGYINLLKRNRPKSIVCHCAVAEKDEEEATFYANSRGSLSTLDKSQEKRWKEEFGHYFTGFEEQIRLDEVLNEDIDILKLDLQGYELEALKGCERIFGRIKTITTETEFVPLYEGQPLFGDIDVFLRNKGFKLLNLYELYTHPDGQLTSGEAVYLNTRWY